MWREVASSSCGNRESAWAAVQIWRLRPNLVNRRLAGIEVLYAWAEGDSLVLYNVLPAQFLDFCEKALFEQRVLQFEIHALIPKGKHFRETCQVVSKDAPYQMVFFPIDSPSSVLFGNGDHPQVSSPSDGTTKSCNADCIYRISVKETELGNNLQIDVWSPSKDSSPGDTGESAVSTTEWLRSHLLPKLVSWSNKPPPRSNDGTPTATKSLRLVSVREYAKTYQRLKDLYYADLVQSWIESTDPKKFVSEDLGIAAYLMCLWEMERNRGLPKQSFADLGCGNGLLAYILQKEGYNGVGIDVRSRKTWTVFGQDVKLEERTFDPVNERLPQYDWLIGNHSDELTPWIPWVASRSSYNTRFFLLPCCAFDFDRKFNKPGNESEYHSYLKYVRQLCGELGFVFQEDVLRIPSTKRTCFVGRKRNYLEANEAVAEERRQKFFASRTSARNAAGFVVRTPEDATKTVFRIAEDMKRDIIKLIVDKLLETKELVEVESKQWNQGGTLELSKLAESLSPDMIQALRNQCGGLQTFLKNNQGHAEK